MAQNEAGSSAACLCIPVVENYQNRKANLCTLKLQLRKLKRLEGNLEERLRRNENFGDDLQIWWRAARDFQHEVEACHFDDKVDQRCIRGYMPDCFARYSNGKQILEMINKANDLLQEFDERSFSPSLLTDVKGRIRPCTRLIGVQAAEVTELIWYFLKKGNNVNIIGIYGVAGSGKTSIVSQIHNRALEEKRNHKFNMVRQINNPRKCFDYVFWVDVGSESNTIESLQQRIAIEVDIKPFEDSDDATKRAATLSNVLINKGSYLLILDDMWTNVSLKDVGIPEPMAENGCKIIVTSRSVEVCRSMKSDKDVKVELLSNDDAWALFAYEVGPNFINMSWEAKTIAQNVLRECCRLPLGIITVARTLRYVTDSLCWEQTLTTLRESTKNVVEMDEKPFENLRFSYERLSDGASNGQTKSCFLYCALYPEDYHIATKELIECWMWEGLLGDAGRIKAKMQQGEMVLKKLKDARLIEGVYHEDGAEEVTMHHLIREMVIHITKARPCFLISSEANEMKPPDEWPHDVERVSLMRNELKELLSKPKCPKLNTLLLQHNYSLTSKFCNDFFTEMPLLRVLNLSYTGISSLPDLSKLKNLQALLVCSCWKLKRLPSLRGLEALKVLNISYTGITKLPDGMEELTNLRRLDLSYTKVTNFRSRLLRACEHLEELLMYGCNFFWGEASIEELKAFQNLLVLEVNFSNEHVFDAYVRSDHWYPLTSFKFCVSEIYSGTLGNYDISIMKNFHVNGFPVLLPDHTTDLHVTRCEDITQLQIPGRLENLKVVDISDCGNLKILFKHTVVCQLPNLQQITIKRCQSVVKVIEDEENNDTQAVFLPHLLSLTLVDLPKLECIYDGLVVWDSLQTIEVLMCKNLKRIPLSADGQKTIRGEEAWFKSLEWNDPNSQTLFEIWSETATAPEEQLSRQTALSSSSNSSSSETTDFTRTMGFATTDIEKASSTEGTSNTYITHGTFSVPSSGPGQSRFSDKDDICLTGEILPAPNLMIYSFADLKSATRNFRRDTILGIGDFGIIVYKGWVDEKTLAPSKVGTGMAVAIKKLNPESVQGYPEWQAEVSILGTLSHPNLVKLLGYCWEGQERFLVYEFMPKGSLDLHLFKRSAIEPLSWDLRLKIAIGAARGLAFLHISENKIIYRDFKASSILLDGDYNAKLSDFGLPRFSTNSHVMTRITGTYGYAAPEYIATGHLYVKSDVYGFGVVLLEMLTGLQALDKNRPSGQHNLVVWAKPLLSNRRKLKSIMDPRMEGQYFLRAALEAAQLILNCLEQEPRNRPSMREVAEVLERIEAMKVKPKRIQIQLCAF